MPGLLVAEHVAGTADLQVFHGDRHAGAQICVGRQRGQPVVRSLGQRLLGRVEEVGVAALAGASDPATKLVQLRQAHPVGAVDNQGVRGRHVDAGLHDGGADQHVDVAFPEVEHHLLQVAFRHLAMRGDDGRLRHRLAQLSGHLLDVLHPVVDEEDLPLTSQFTTDRGSHLSLVVGPGEGQHRMALLGRGGDGRHLADAGDGHLEGARDRGGTHRQHVDVDAHFLECLLVLDAEPLLLVDDHQAQVGELHLVTDQPVGADRDVDASGRQPVEGRGDLFVGLETTQGCHGHRETGVALGEGVGVLLHQQGGRHQHRDLLAVLHGLERGPHGYLGLAVPDVTADQPVHRDHLLHVSLDVVDRRQLVGGLGVAEGVLQLALPRRVGAERVALGGLPRRIQLDQLGRDLANCLAGPGFALPPIGAAHLVEAGCFAAHIAGDLVQLIHRDVEPVARLATLGRRVLQHQVLPGGAGHGTGDHLDVASHPVLLVHQRVPRLQLKRDDLVAPAGGHLAGGALVAGAGDVGGGVHHQPDARRAPAVAQATTEDAHHRGLVEVA